MKIFSLNNINFGKKIPLKECYVIEKKNNKQTPATVYEHDCTDLFDAYEVQKSNKNFAFRDLIISGMHKKFINNRAGIKSTGHYYTLQKNDGEILGLCHTTEDKDVEVALLSSRKLGKYKYVGQNILSALAQKTISQNKEELKVTSVLEEAEDFYEKACGFEKRFHDGYEPYFTFHLSKENIPNFIEKVEKKTNYLA
ncbi:hypothetical protein IKA92_07040 [bacterium]|nr:hypothetical protein [bacterium]